MVVAFLYLIFKPFDFGPFLGGVDVILLKLDLLSTISLYHLCLEESHHSLPVYLQYIGSHLQKYYKTLFYL